MKQNQENPQQQQHESVLKFPAQISIKAMGRAEAGFETIVHALVIKHLDDGQTAEVTRLESKKGNYVSVSVACTVNSRSQLEAIYRDLHENASVLYTL